MPKFLSGFMLGVVVTFVILDLFDTSPSETQARIAKLLRGGG